MKARMPRTTVIFAVITPLRLVVKSVTVSVGNTDIDSTLSL